MTQISTHSWIRIQCPRCKARYRIDRSKVPQQGITLRCKKCQTKLILKTQPKKQALAPDRCPKCGFQQKQGEFCYKCGARIRNTYHSKVTTSNQDLPANQIPVALIDLNIEYKPAFFLLSIVKPMIEIDRELYPRSWGKHQFQVPPGKYHFKIYGQFFGQHIGEQSQIINVQKDDYIQLQYSAESWNRALFHVVKHETATPWRSLIQKPSISTTNDQPWYYKPFPVIFSLVTFFPLGIYLLWKSRQFPDSHKLIIAIVGLLAFLWILFNLNPVSS